MLVVNYPELEIKAEYKLVTPPAGRFCVVNPDYDQQWEEEDVRDIRYSYHVSRPTRNRTAYTALSESGSPIGKGAPATARFIEVAGSRGTVEFTDDFQRYVHDVCSIRSGQAEDVNKTSFRSIFRDNVMMCDFGGTWTRYDAINDNKLERFIALKPMVCGGSLLKIAFESEKYYFVEGVNESNFELYTSALWLGFAPVISIRDWIFDEKGNILHKYEFYAEPFPQYNMKSWLPVLGTIRDGRSSTGYVSAIQKSRCRELLPGERVKNPFIMRQGYRANPYEGFTA